MKVETLGKAAILLIIVLCINFCYEFLIVDAALAKSGLLEGHVAYKPIIIENKSSKDGLEFLGYATVGTSAMKAGYYKLSYSAAIIAGLAAKAKVFMEAQVAASTPDTYEIWHKIKCWIYYSIPYIARFLISLISMDKEAYWQIICIALISYLFVTTIVGYYDEIIETEADIRFMKNKKKREEKEKELKKAKREARLNLISNFFKTKYLRFKNKKKEDKKEEAKKD